MKPLAPQRRLTRNQRAALEHCLSFGRWGARVHADTIASLTARKLATKTGRLTPSGLKRISVKPGRKPGVARLRREAEIARLQMPLDLVQADGGQ